MAVFAYRGLTPDGRAVRGVVDADSARGARARLRRDGVFPTELREERPTASGAGGGLVRRWSGRVRTTDLAVLSRQLGTLTGAGVPVVEALGAVGEQSERPAVSRVLSHVRDRVTQGSSLADALAEHPAVFPDLYVGMVRAGEAAGALDLVLDRLATYTESQSRLATRVRAALSYPILMSAVSAGIVTFLLAFVVPKVTKIFTEQKQELPIPTRILLGISNGVAASWWFLLLLLVAAGFALNAALRRPASRLWLDRKLLALPIVGSLVTRIAVARFARTLGTLIENGIPLLAALDVAGGVTGHPAMAAAVEDARTAVREGQPLAAPLRQSGLFPPLLIHMIAVGERSGEVEAMLDKAADSYEQEVESSLATLTATLEPAMILVMGGVMLFIVLAILLPIFQINAMVH